MDPYVDYGGGGGVAGPVEPTRPRGPVPGMRRPVGGWYGGGLPAGMRREPGPPSSPWGGATTSPVTGGVDPVPSASMPSTRPMAVTGGMDPVPGVTGTVGGWQGGRVPGMARPVGGWFGGGLPGGMQGEIARREAARMQELAQYRQMRGGY